MTKISALTDLTAAALTDELPAYRSPGNGRLTVKEILDQASHRLLFSSNTLVTKTDADTVETVLASYVIPAGTIQANDTIRLAWKADFPNSAATKTFKAKIAGQPVCGTFTFTTSKNWVYQADLTLRNNLTQIYGPMHSNTSAFGINASTNIIGVNGLNFAIDQTFEFTGQHNTSGSGSLSINLYALTIERLRVL